MQTVVETKGSRFSIFQLQTSKGDTVVRAHASPEMPTSRNLKSGDSLFFTSPLPWKFRTLYRVLHEVDTIQIRDHRFEPEIIFVSDWIGVKCLRNRTTVTNKKNSSFELKMG